MNKNVIYGLTVFWILSLKPAISQISPPKWISQLAEKENLEVVYGERFPYINNYSLGYGSPVITGILSTGKKVWNENVNDFVSERIQYVLFLARKKINNTHHSDNLKDIINNYSYYLIFATSEEYNGNYEVVDVFEGFHLAAMHRHYGAMDKELSEFRFIKNKSKNGPENVQVIDTFNNPIIIDYEDVTVVLIYYEGEWLEFVDADL